MTLADHLRPLLRDHDCVIIPDFGGLVAEYAAAHVQPAGRHLLSPPTRQVAFNQALTRNDGLLVDALRQHLGLSAAEAREHLRQAVALLHHELHAQQRTELPGIGVFRQLAGRGLQFEYTGTENLLAAAFGLPELTAYPVAAIDARLAREQQAQLVPRLRSVAQRSSRVPLRQLLRGGAIGLAAGVVAAALYLLSLHPAVLPVAWQGYVPRWEQAAHTVAPQQATLTLARPSLGEGSPVVELAPAAPAIVAKKTPLDSVAAPTVGPKKEVVAVAVPTAAAAPVSLVAKKVTVPSAPATTLKAPVAAAAKPMLSAKDRKTVVSKPVVSVKDSKSVAVVAAKPAAPAVAKAVAVPATVAKALAPAAATIKARTGRFYIVVGAYTSLAGAARGRHEVVKAGRPAGQTKIILPFPGTNKYRISAADFASYGEAQAAAARLRQDARLDKGLSVYAY
ncbi:MAG: hypothetical protein EOO36_03660 [Cytophagaceae bacterium]|nr:MAG: hypothetical protein EOO36_03660 [Cytophagaceae bacterium]